MIAVFKVCMSKTEVYFFSVCFLLCIVHVSFLVHYFTFLPTILIHHQLTEVKRLCYVLDLIDKLVQNIFP
uniref:Callose synthase 10 isoform X2 n=1 Tax=Rhizophora mucronata TaxID=61149 RepID=A0A2P2MBN7_RHIMU